MRAFDLDQNQRPLMTLKPLKGHYALCFKTRISWCCNSFIFSFTFDLFLINKWLPVV